MARRSRNISHRDQKKIWIAVVLLLVFAAGFLVARVRYKPLIKESFNMVMEREDVINDLKAKIKAYEDKIMMEETKTRIRF